MILKALQDTTSRKWPSSLRHLLKKDKIEFKLVDGLAYFREQLLIPDHENLRLEIIHHTHALGPAGHPGRVKTIDLPKRSYRWLRLRSVVETFVKGCALCFRTKTPRASPPGLLKLLDVSLRVWADISIDHVLDLPPFKRNGKVYYHILAIVDQLTKMRHLIPVTTLDTTELLERFVQNIYKLHGAPETIVSDRGSAFVSDFWRRLNTRLSISFTPSSAVYPQTNGQTEIVNSVLNKYLRDFLSFTQVHLVDWLPLAKFSSNNQISETTGVSRFLRTIGLIYVLVLSQQTQGRQIYPHQLKRNISEPMQ